ncbi:MAG TPA: Uma2 family endonuclease [Verrucomicrobiota bacterium]|nr:Uma2 family endonuclease [Verrucomicrobiota bacterium]
MNSILDEPAVRRAAFPVSVEFYHELGRLGLLDKSVELLDGVIIRKMSKSPLHASVVRRFARLIAGALKPGQLLLREDPITTVRSEPEPDLAVVEGREEDFFEAHPRSALLAIEIAVSSVELDRRKAAIYAAAGVAEYWLVEPEPRRITVFREPAGEVYQQMEIVDSPGVLESRALPSLRVNLSELFER